MSDGTTTLDRTNADAPAAKTDEADSSVEVPAPAEADPAAETLTETEAAEDDNDPAESLEEVEFAGKQYRLPKELKSALMMHADYTRKTQEVAEGRRALEAERTTLQLQAAAHQNNIQDVVHLANLNVELAAYEQRDWHKLEAEDPAKAQLELSKYVMIRDRRDALVGRMQLNERRHAIEVTQAHARRYEQTSAQLARDIKGWNEVAPKLADFAKANGVSDAEMEHLAVNAPLVKLLHKAWLGDQLIRKQSAAAAKADAEASPAPEPLKQVARGRGAVASSGLSDSLSVEEWVKRRNAQVRKQA